MNKELKGYFNSAYHYLMGAKELQDDIEIAAVNEFRKKIIERIKKYL